MIRRSTLFACFFMAGAAMAQTADPVASASASASASMRVSSIDPGPAADQLIKIDKIVGTGAEALPGKTVVVHYTGWLYKPLAREMHGKKFDSSRDPGRTPFDFALGGGNVIKGWDQGVAGMKVGGRRTLIIPSELAYGKRVAAGGAIPADSPLIFDVDLIEVK